MDRLPINLQGARRGEVLPWPERRRRWSWKEKAQIVAESLAPDAVASAIARRYGLHRNQLYAWRKALRATADDATARKELWDDIPLILKEIRNNKFAKYCFEIDYKQTYRNGILVPWYYWQSKVKEIEALAKTDNLVLIPISTLIDEGVIAFFDGHGSPPAKYKGMGEYPYIRGKDIVNWEVYKDQTAKIPEDIYIRLKGIKKNLKERDVVYVRRGSYRIGSVAMVSPYDIEVVLTREILVLRVVNENNKYNLTPHYLLYLLSHALTSMQRRCHACRIDLSTHSAGLTRENAVKKTVVGKSQ